MKIQLLAACLAVAAQMPAFAQANVTFAAPAGYRLTVELNGIRQTDDQYVRIENTTTGECTARLTAVNGSGQSYSIQSSLTLPDRRETSYFVLVENGALQVHWTNETALPNTAPLPAPQPAYDEDRRSGYDSPFWNKGGDEDGYADAYRNDTYGSNGHGSPYGQGRDYSRRGGPDAYRHHRQMLPVLSPGEVVRLQRAVRQVPFDTDRMHILLNTLRRASLTAGSVRELTRSLSFDRNRLDFAKRAYASTVDPHNYYTVASAFDFSANARELRRFVMHH